MELAVKHFSELSREELFAIYKLRVAVFVVEQHCPYQEVDEADQAAARKPSANLIRKLIPCVPSAIRGICAFLCAQKKQREGLAFRSEICYIDSNRYLDNFLNIKKRKERGAMGEPFKALADPTRRRILQLLNEGDLTAGEIAEHFDMTKPSVSHHLAILKQAGLVTDERQGQNILYRLNLTVFQELLKWFYDFGLVPGQADPEKEEHHEGE